MALFMNLNGVEVSIPFALAIIILVACATGLSIAFYGKSKVRAAARKTATA